MNYRKLYVILNRVGEYTYCPICNFNRNKTPSHKKDCMFKEVLEEVKNKLNIPTESQLSIINDVVWKVFGNRCKPFTIRSNSEIVSDDFRFYIRFESDYDCDKYVIVDTKSRIEERVEYAYTTAVKCLFTNQFLFDCEELVKKYERRLFSYDLSNFTNQLEKILYE